MNWISLLFGDATCKVKIPKNYKYIQNFKENPHLAPSALEVVPSKLDLSEFELGIKRTKLQFRFT